MGVQNDELAAKHMQITKGIGFTPNRSETANARGKAKAAAALLVISSVKMLVIKNRAARIIYIPYDLPSTASVSEMMYPAT